MKCPICNLDLSPLDLVSRTEHVDLCIENGPSVLDIDESGKLIVKKNVPPGKQRKICPICDKTFQSLNQHFKVCAIKNDVPPSLMLDYWDKINSDVKNPKKFPRELLDSFVAKCIREGRVGDQVDFARALSMSMADGQPEQTGPSISGNTAIELAPDNRLTAAATSSETPTPTESNVRNATEILMTAPPPAKVAPSINRAKSSNSRPKFRLELVDDNIKRSNVELRIDRELAATRSKRYQEALMASRLSEEDGECMIIGETQPPAERMDKLFHRARLKDCNESIACTRAECQDHELELMLVEFRIYSGASMDAAPKQLLQEQQQQALQSTSETDASEAASGSFDGAAAACVSEERALEEPEL